MNRRNFVQLVTSFLAFLGLKPSLSERRVWVVYYNDCDFGGVVSGIFSSEDTAVRYIGNAPKDRYHIVSHTLDKGKTRVFRPVYHAGLELNGSSDNFHTKTYDLDVTNETEFVDKAYTIRAFYNAESRARLSNHPFFQAQSWVSPERALELATRERNAAIEYYPDYFS